MKKFISIILVVFLVAGLYGCSSKKSDISVDKPDPPKATESPEPTILPTQEPEETVIKTESYDYGDDDTVVISLTDKGKDKLVLSFNGFIADNEKASLAFVYLWNEAISYSEKYEVSVSVICDEGLVAYAGNILAGTNSDGTYVSGKPDWLISDTEDFTIDENTMNEYLTDVMGFVENFISDL